MGIVGKVLCKKLKTIRFLAKGMEADMIVHGILEIIVQRMRGKTVLQNESLL